MAGLWVNECGNALDVELSAGVGEVEARGRRRDDDLRFTPTPRVVCGVARERQRVGNVGLAYRRKCISAGVEASVSVRIIKEKSP